eukprot:TRINITY_DN5932_c0_g2_i4.p1 TRINITY_DN5932_c0_g2~~TRINITY_DN5932_c0_g2_i4.p1  ORF type:complete len:662 (+),score=209.52 TRINITY_DN5932_c0_g2_i4:124-2109(+)
MSNTYVLHDAVRGGSMESYISGRERPKYFKRPLVPTINDISPQFAPPPIAERDEDLIEETSKHRAEPRTRTVEVQTMFRESEAQTDPYTPAYRVLNGENPEVLRIAHLVYGRGLPASVEEMELIEQMREKVAFEGALPPTSDEASFTLRRRLMEDQEFREWHKREDEIKIMQNERLNLLQTALIEREKDVEERNAQRIEEIKIRKTEQKNRLIAKIQRRKIKVLRKMLKRRKDMDKPQKRDMVEEYANFASRVYAAITREGVSLDKIANRYEVQPMMLNTYQGVSDLAQKIPRKQMSESINVAKVTKDIQKAYTRRELVHKNELKKAEDEIYGHNLKQVEEVQENRRWSLNQMKIRPPTPEREEVIVYDQQIKEEDEVRYIVKQETDANRKDFDEPKQVKRQQKFQLNSTLERGIIFLQRLLRGRAVQNIMYEGKEKRLALIDELLTVAKIKKLPKEEVDKILMGNQEEKYKDAMIEALQGEIISETLDLLSKEALRFRQQNKIAAMARQAEEERRKREAEETGRRQAEVTLRDRENVLYEELIRLHKTTADSYLSWIIKNSVEKSSERQASIMSNLKRTKIDDQIGKTEQKVSTTETMIKDLVSSFLIPNIQRDKIQKRIHLIEKKYFDASKHTLAESFQQVSKKLDEVPTVQPRPDSGK